MRPRDQHPYGEGGHDRSGGRFDLFYYERVGERFYLRLTPLAAALVIGLTLLSIGGIVFFYIYNSGRTRRMTDVNVQLTGPHAAPTTQNPIVMPAKPVLQPPRVVTPTPKIMKDRRGQGVSPTPLPSPDTEATPVKTPSVP